MLHEFIEVNRDEIIRRCRVKVAGRSVPPPTTLEIDHGVPVFLDQLRDALRFGVTMTPEIGRSALQHGHDLLLQGCTVSQVVHDYGDICQAITDLALEMEAPISTDDFRSRPTARFSPRQSGTCWKMRSSSRGPAPRSL